MNKYHIIYAVMVIALSSMIVVVVLKNNNLNMQIHKTTDQLNNFDQYYKLLRYRDIQKIKNDGIPLSPDLTMSDINNNPIELIRLVHLNNATPKIILKNSALACNICIEEEFKQLDKHMSAIGKENIIVLASDYNVRGLINLKKNSPFTFDIFQIQTLGIPFEEHSNSLCVFVLDEDLRIRDFFIPEKTLPELSENYYKTIAEKYF